MTILAAIMLAEAVAVTSATPVAPVVDADAVAPAAVTNAAPEAVAEEAVAEEPVSEAAAVTNAAPGGVRITSDRTDYDNKAGVIMFDGHVALDATVRGERYTMNAGQMFVFLDGTNDMKRVVALGGVAVTNGFRVGTCEKAVYAKAANRVTMHGGDDGAPARLVSEDPKQRGDLSGRKITFWLDSEQVEVEGSTVNLDASRLSRLEKAKDGKGGIKGIFGK